MATTEELKEAAKSYAMGVIKGNTADTLGAPVDLVNTFIAPATKALGIHSEEPVGGSAFFRKMANMDVRDNNLAETAGSMISIGGVAKTIIGSAAAAGTAITAIQKLGNTPETLSLAEKTVDAASKYPMSQRGMIVGAERMSAQNKNVDALKASELSLFHPEVNRASVYNLTGAFQGSADAGLRSVISDAGAKLKPTDKELWKPVKLDEILDHPELFKLYPEFRNIDVVTDIMKNKGEGSYMSAAGTGSNPLIRLSPSDLAWSNGALKKGGYPDKTDTVVGTTLDRTKSVLLHEVQHAVQDVEGWTRGGSPKQFLPPNIDAQAKSVQKAVIEGRKSADPSVRDAAERFKDRFNSKIQTAHTQYENIPGEQEARFTQDVKDIPIESLAKSVKSMLQRGMDPQNWDTQKLPPAVTSGTVVPAATNTSQSTVDRIKGMIFNPK